MDDVVFARPHAAAHAPFAPAVDIHRLGVADAQDEAGAIADLAGRALEANVFREPAFMLPALSAFAPEAEILTLRRSGRLDAVLPLHFGPGLFAGAQVPALFANPFQPLGTPLIDRHDPEGLWTAALDEIAVRSSALLVPHLPLDGPVFAALERAALRSGRAVHVARTETRAVLRAGPTAEAWTTARDRRSRKEEARLGRRLADRGTVVASVSTGDAVAAAFDTFAVLEASGWKGRRRTALAQDPDTIAFARAAVVGLAERDLVRIDRIDLDGRPIAMLINLGGPERPITWKIAFDETFAAFSPGTLLWLQATARMLAEPGFELADSLAVETHPLAGRLWTDRATVGTVVVALDRTGLGARLAVAEIRAVAALKDRLRRLLRRSPAGRPNRG